MILAKKGSYILNELRDHVPFTLFGSLLGVVFMLIFKGLSHSISLKLFYVFHPAHVLLSAIVTTSIFRIYNKKANIILVLIVGYVGSIGVATLSDSLVPYAGEAMLGLHGISAHGHETAETEHELGDISHDHDAHETAEKRHIHIGFIEGWYIVNPAAILGILIAYFLPHTKFPHAGHVLLSIWASLFHVLMALGSNVSWGQYLGIFAFLFVAVWLPCCFSDIVFPLLFIKPGEKIPTHSH